MKISKKLRKRQRNLSKVQEFSVNLGALPRNTIAGFPIRDGAINNLWNWQTLETVKFK